MPETETENPCPDCGYDPCAEDAIDPLCYVFHGRLLERDRILRELFTDAPPKGGFLPFELHNIITNNKPPFVPEETN